ncbi:hypothetical protein B0J14DRAFT_682833 [Halenospora varia]|nr:hypothetical protein B0J14DRAFT_682833 [Halenospora varia]
MHYLSTFHRDLPTRSRRLIPRPGSLSETLSTLPSNIANESHIPESKVQNKSNTLTIILASGTLVFLAVLMVTAYTPLLLFSFIFAAYESEGLLTRLKAVEDNLVEKRDCKENRKEAMDGIENEIYAMEEMEEVEKEDWNRESDNEGDEARILDEEERELCKRRNEEVFRNPWKDNDFEDEW